MLDIVRGGSATLERPIEELVIVYTQPQSAYVAMAEHVPLVKLFRLESKITLDEFTALLGADKQRIKAGIFDGVKGTR